MPSFLLSRNTPQNAASVPCCSRTCRSGPLNPAIISRRSFSLGGVISKVAMAYLMRYRWGTGGILSHYRVHSDIRQMQVSSYNGWRVAPDRDRERRAAKSAKFHPGMVHMYNQLSGRLVMFFVARCHEDLSWFLSIEPEILN